MKANRDRKTGRYVDTLFDKICRCGHTLGEHTAVKVGGEQPCLHGTDGRGEPCECECFKWDKTKPAKP